MGQEEDKQPEDFLFTSRLKQDGKFKPYSDCSSLNKTLKRYCKDLGIKKKNVSCHSFRHMFITKNIEKHGLETTRVLAGHKKSRTTELYNHANFD